MEKIFITGGAGYVGSALVPKLLNLGYEVTVLDLMIYGQEVLDDHKKLTKIQGDIRNQDLLKKILPGHKYLIHLACISNDPSFELNPTLGKSINLDAFEPMVKIAKEKNIERFIYASSSSVYGVSTEKNVKEDHPLVPLTLYNKFKGMCEPILLKYADKNFCPVIFRPATVCGYSPRMRLDLTVNILTNHAYNNNKIRVFGGTQLRPNIHIQDYCDFVEILIESETDKIFKQVFNVGSEEQVVAHVGVAVLAQPAVRAMHDDLVRAVRLLEHVEARGRVQRRLQAVGLVDAAHELGGACDEVRLAQSARRRSRQQVVDEQPRARRHADPRAERALKRL